MADSTHSQSSSPTSATPRSLSAGSPKRVVVDLVSESGDEILARGVSITQPRKRIAIEGKNGEYSILLKRDTQSWTLRGNLLLFFYN